MKALSGFLRPEFINRVDEIVTFRSLSREDFVSIARILLDELKEALSEQGVTFTYTDEAADFIASESYSARFGARNMRRYIRRHVEDQLAEAIIADYQRAITHAKLLLSDGHLTVACM